MEGIFEVSYTQGHLMPELSYGSHFFQDLVESGVFYGAIFDGDEGVVFDSSYILDRPNLIEEFTDSQYADVIQVIRSEGVELFSDTVEQRMICVEM